MENNKQATQEDIHNIEVKLIKQEHRLWPILSNFAKYIMSGDKKKRNASVFALILNFLFSRSILLLGFAGGLTYYFAWENNRLLKNQNRLIKEQSKLIEAERRGSLVFLFSNIMDAIDVELKAKDGKKNKRNLSPQLIGRIIALSNRLKPYYFLEGDSLTLKPLSPERGQLLTTLIANQLDTSTLKQIFSKAKFLDADLKDTDLSCAYLVGINLERSDLSKSSFTGANLREANLKRTNLDNAQLRYAILDESNLSSASLIHANLGGSSLYRAKLGKANLFSASVKGVNFREANLQGANLRQTEIIGISLPIKLRNYCQSKKQMTIEETAFDNVQVSEDFIDSLKSYHSDSIIGMSTLLKKYEVKKAGRMIIDESGSHSSTYELVKKKPI